MDNRTKDLLLAWAEEYNNPKYFIEDPIFFPRKFFSAYKNNAGIKSDKPITIQDIEIASIFSAHFAWGRRVMIVRDCNRLFDEMNWEPFDYVMNGDWKRDNTSIHRTIKWTDVAKICENLKSFYSQHKSLEILDTQDIRTLIFGQKEDKKAPNKKINMMKRWLVRNDNKVDLGIWKNTSPKDLLIPLDVHVHNVATILGLTDRRQKDINTVKEITESFNNLFTNDPCKGDFALFGYGVTHPKDKKV